MDKLLELDDIMLQPADMNSGCHPKDYSFGTTDHFGCVSLPIFTSPMPSVVDKTNWRVYEKAGIRTILPRTCSIEDRLEACQYMFAAFSLGEIKENFLGRGKRSSQYQFKVCFDVGNGGDTEIFNLSSQLRTTYQDQICIMAGNIGNEKTYVEYCRAGIDFVRVGITGGSLVNTDKFGFHSPLASLLIKIIGLKKTACIGLKETKIIADGGIDTFADIIKAIALGADYVMIGRQFAKILEASGPIYQRTKNQEGRDVLEAVSPDIAKDLSQTELRDLGLQRLYCGNTTLDIQAQRNGYDNIHDWKNAHPKPFDSRAEWVKINYTLDNWISDLYEVFTYGFVMGNATNWKEYKENIKFGMV